MQVNSSDVPDLLPLIGKYKLPISMYGIKKMKRNEVFSWLGFISQLGLNEPDLIRLHTVDTNHVI